MSEASDHHDTHYTALQTVPDDIDLDANAHTSSYAGHYLFAPEQTNSLKMLLPSKAQATQLARIKALRQRRFDDWSSYHKQGQSLVENLPRTFEETVVHNFVDGIFKETHRKQCRQWLDLNGWNWANVSAFGGLCSQILADNPVEAMDGSDQSKPPRQMKDMLAAAGLAAQHVEGANSRMKNNKARSQPAAALEQARRSQRLIEKESLDNDLRGTASPDSASNPRKSNEISKPEILVRNRGAKQTTKKVPPQPRKATKVLMDEPLPNFRGTRKREADLQGAESPSKQPRFRPKGKSADNNISIPQIASAKQQTALLRGDSSDDEGFLYKRAPAQYARPKGGNKNSGRTKSVRHAYGVNKHRHKKDRMRKLPLPPPPEIPILPTTDED